MIINTEITIYLTIKIMKKHIWRKLQLIKKEINWSNKKQTKFINLVVKMKALTKWVE